jgi:hypothetical protein
MPTKRFEYTVETVNTFGEARCHRSPIRKKMVFGVLHRHDVAATLAEKSFSGPLKTFIQSALGERSLDALLMPFFVEALKHVLRSRP